MAANGAAVATAGGAAPPQQIQVLGEDILPVLTPHGVLYFIVHPPHPLPLLPTVVAADGDRRL
jgi:hypothetical protein